MNAFLSYFIFKSKMRRIKSSIPDIDKYKNKLIKEWGGLGEYQLKGTPSDIKKILPLKSLKIIDIYSSSKKVDIKFDKLEFEKVINNKVNLLFIEFHNSYYSKNLKDSFNFFIDNIESLELLLDVMESEYYINNEDDALELLNFLIDEAGCIKGDKQDSIKSRMEIELEFIKRRKESQFQ